MSDQFSEHQIQAMFEKINQIKPEEITRERAIKVLNMLPDIADDVTKAYLLSLQRNY